MQDHPHYKYRPRRKKKGEKAATTTTSTATSSSIKSELDSNKNHESASSSYYHQMKNENSSKTDPRLRMETVETPEPSPNELGPMSGSGLGGDNYSGFYGYSSTLPTPEISPQDACDPLQAMTSSDGSVDYHHEVRAGFLLHQVTTTFNTFYLNFLKRVFIAISCST
jgi:hypothetical protein